MKDLTFLFGNRIYLRPLIEDDAQGEYLRWFNDEEVCKGNSHHVVPYTFKKIKDYIEFSHRSKDNLILAIVLTSNDKHIGNISLQEINYIYRSADLAIIIGDKSIWGKGYGYEASTLLLCHGFNTMNLNRISCATFDTNFGMKKLALALGMKEEGRRVHAVYKNGNYIDIIEYGILKADYINIKNIGENNG